jgi:hypothetical protein
MDSDVDIEHLISVLEANSQFSTTQKIKRYYHQAIIDLSKEMIKDVHDSPHAPNLYSVLFDFHSIGDLNEKITGVLSLNYEDLLEQTLLWHLSTNINYYIARKTRRNANREIPVVKLHGSFSWKNRRPIFVDVSRKINSDDALWIPPGVDKKRENYPFNVLWGKAFELLMECDVLRVIGCSLNRNDWGLIPMIYTAMKLRDSASSFEIEIIDFVDQGERIRKTYPYLKIKSLTEILEYRNYLVDLFSLTSSTIPAYVRDTVSSDSSKRQNIFESWLRAKGHDLVSRGKKFNTRKNHFSNFIK